MAMVRGQYAQVLAPIGRKVFNQWMDTFQRDLEYPSVFHVENSTRAYEDELEFAGTPPVPEKPELTPIQYTQILQGGTFRFIHLTYSQASRVSYELYDDDQLGVIKQIPKSHARGLRHTEEMVAWNVFNQGFTVVKSIDGVTLFNNQHPLRGGPSATINAPGLAAIISAQGTYPNRPAVDIDISFAGIQLMTNQYERMVDGVGILVLYKPEKILAAPANRFLLRELLGSPGKPGVATNDINSLLGEDLGYSIVHYTTNDSAWFALCNKSMHRLKFYRREAAWHDMDDDFDTNAVKSKVTTRFSVGPANWLGTWGTLGT